MQLKSSSLLLAVSLPLTGFIVSCAQNSVKDSQLLFSQKDKIIKTGDNDKSKKNRKNRYTANPYCTDLMDSTANPLGPYEWHLYSYGNSAYATAYTQEQHAASLGQDINAYDVLKTYCLSGNGVNVGILDTGLQVAHPSLAPNIDNRPYESQTWSVNYRQNRLWAQDPSPIAEDEEDHGTMVAGIIAMRSNLGFGGSGVAPRANLAAYNVINMDTQFFDNFYESLGASDASKNNHVFNMSYGLNNTSQVGEDDPIEMASLAMMKTGTKLLRQGKGAVYIKAAGNGFNSVGSSYDFTSCRTAKQYHVSCQDVNMNPDNALPQVISVGALNSYGKKTSYSTTGAALWVAVPGGEFGFDKNWVNGEFDRFSAKVDWNSFTDTIGEPAVVSTDMMGSRAGLAQQTDLDNMASIFNIRNAFNAGLVPENYNYNYTNSMNGTSSATPLTVGSVAVILEANPNLTWRDVKHVLASTATKVDPEFTGVRAELTHGTYQLEDGWVTNAAGYHFSNWYGFGRINLKAAVDMAVDYQENLGQFIEKPWWPTGKLLNKDVPAGDYNGVTRTVNIAARDNLVVEGVQIKVSLESDYVGDLAIELTSPSGTKNIVWHAGNAFANNGDIIDMTMLTNAFYGEESVGDWTARVINTGIHNTKALWTGFQIKVSGHKKGE